MINKTTKVWRPINTYGLLFVGFCAGSVITYVLVSL